MLSALVSILACALSGAALSLSYPPPGLSFLAWVALVPLFITISRGGLKTGFVVSFFCGLIYFIGVFRWILDFPGFTFLHQAILGVYVGLFFGVFSLFFKFVTQRCGLTMALLSAPLVWVSLEYTRCNLSFMSLPWGLLAHSQYAHPTVIQISSFTGPYGVSFLVVLVNAALAGLAIYLLDRPPKKGLPSGSLIPGRGAGIVGATAAVLTAFTLIYGSIIISEPIEGKPVRVSVVQGNITQDEKWDLKYARFIMDTYTHLTKEAAEEGPDLIVWPETATPSAINRSPWVHARVKQSAREASTPLLLGSAQQQKIRKRGQTIEYVNSAYLVSPEKRQKNIRYDKIHLMPFGEYLPLQGVIPWSYINIPDVGDYVPGNKFTVFDLPGFRFGVTICWESLFPDLVRRFVLNGAQFIVNITNEAWFGKSSAAYQFLSMTAFRAVENRVFVVRCGNTGISCFIDPYGRILDRVRDATGQDIFVRGFLTGDVIPQDYKTLYTRYGDFFAWLCMASSAGFLIMAFLRRSRASGH